jgi:hypothetical protein
MFWAKDINKDTTGACPRFFMMPAPKDESRRLTKGARLSTGMLIYIFYNEIKSEGAAAGACVRI